MRIFVSVLIICTAYAIHLPALSSLESIFHTAHIFSKHTRKNVLIPRDSTQRILAVVNGTAYEKSTGSSNQQNFPGVFLPIECVAFQGYPLLGETDWLMGKGEDAEEDNSTPPYVGKSLDLFLSKQSEQHAKDLENMDIFYLKWSHCMGRYKPGPLQLQPWIDELLTQLPLAGTPSDRLWTYLCRFSSKAQLLGSFSLGWPKESFEEEHMDKLRKLLASEELPVFSFAEQYGGASNNLAAVIEANDFLVSEGVNVIHWSQAKSRIELCLECARAGQDGVSPAKLSAYQVMPSCCAHAIALIMAARPGRELDTSIHRSDF